MLSTFGLAGLDLGEIHKNEAKKQTRTLQKRVGPRAHQANRTGLRPPNVQQNRTPGTHTAVIKPKVFRAENRPKQEKPNKDIAKNGRPQTTPNQQERTQTPKCSGECAPDVQKRRFQKQFCIRNAGCRFSMASPKLW